MTDLFKDKAKDWDANSRRVQLSKAISEAIISNVRLNQELNVLDFGAGTGLITSQIAPLVRMITAVDVSQSMLDKLMAKNDLKDKVKVICQDITQEPLGVEYELIVSAMAMHHVQDTEQLIAQLFKHLKPGGQIALADLDAEDGSFHSKGTEGVFHNGFDRQCLQVLMEHQGFKDISFVTAHTVLGDKNSYPIFLALANKPVTLI